MSRHTFDNEATNSKIALGWDPALDTYFAVVFNNNSDTPIIWLGTKQQQILQPQTIIEAVRSYAPAIDENHLLKLLRDDKQHSNRLDPPSLNTADQQPSHSLRPRPYPCNHTIADVNALLKTWDSHVANADAAKIHPFYSPGHHELISRIEHLRNDLSRHIVVPRTLWDRFDSILKDHNRQTCNIGDIKLFPSRVEKAMQTFAELTKQAETSSVPITELPAYDKWQNQAQQISELGQELIHDHTAFGPYYEEVSNSWNKITEATLQIDSALHHDTAFHTYKELYLVPAQPDSALSPQETEANAKYRDMRELWQTHLKNSHTANIHPYEYPGASKQMQQLQGLSDNHHLADNARLALVEQTAKHTRDQQAGTIITDYLKKTTQLLQKHEQHNKVAKELQKLGVTADDISPQEQLKLKTAGHASKGEEILQDQFITTYGDYLKRSPDVHSTLRDSVDQLNSAIGRKQSSAKEEHRELTEHQTVDLHHSIKRGMSV